MTGKRACQLLCILLLFIMKKLFTNHLRGQTVFKYKLGIGCYRDNSLIVIIFFKQSREEEVSEEDEDENKESDEKDGKKTDEGTAQDYPMARSVKEVFPL